MSVVLLEDHQKYSRKKSRQWCVIGILIGYLLFSWIAGLREDHEDAQIRETWYERHAPDRHKAQVREALGQAEEQKAELRADIEKMKRGRK